MVSIQKLEFNVKLSYYFIFLYISPAKITLIWHFPCMDSNAEKPKHICIEFVIENYEVLIMKIVYEKINCKLQYCYRLIFIR